MKKYLAALAVGVLASYATSSFGQGTVVFANSTGLVKQWASPTDQTPISVPKGGGFVELVWAPSGAAFSAWNPSQTMAAWLAANPAWSVAGSPVGFTTPAAGKFNGGTLTLTPLTPAGGSVDYVVMGWTGAASSFDAAITAGGMVGQSAKGTTATGNPTTIPPGTAVSIAPTFTGALLAPVPEPTTLALAGLGAAALLIFRRRN